MYILLSLSHQHIVLLWLNCLKIHVKQAKVWGETLKENGVPMFHCMWIISLKYLSVSHKYTSGHVLECPLISVIFVVTLGD